MGEIKVQGLGYEGAEGFLLQTLGYGIDGREPVLDGRGASNAHRLELGVNHLRSEKPGAGLAEATHPSPQLKQFPQACPKVEEPKSERTAIVADRHFQDPAWHDGAVDRLYLPLHQGFGARRQECDRRKPGTILVAIRQMEQQVLDAEDRQALEALGNLLAGTTKVADRSIAERCDGYPRAQSAGRPGASQGGVWPQGTRRYEHGGVANAASCTLAECNAVDGRLGGSDRRSARKASRRKPDINRYGGV